MQAATITRTLLAGIVTLGLGMFAGSAEAATAADVQKAFANKDMAALDQIINSNPGQAGEIANYIVNTASGALGTDLDTAADGVSRIGTLCSADIGPATAEQLAASLRTLVSNLKTQIAQGQSEDKTGAVLTAAMNCAGQPSLVAADAGLYSELLAEAATFVQLAQGDGNQDLDKIVQLARQGPLRTNNNQQPTTTQSFD